MTNATAPTAVGSLTILVSVLKDNFHSYFLRFQTAGLIEFHGAFIAAPYIQGQIIAAMLPGIIQSGVIQQLSDMLSPHGLIHAQIVNIQGFDICHNVVILILLEYTESISLHTVIIVYRRQYGTVAVLKKVFQFFVCIFAFPRFEQVRSAFVMDHGHLSQQTVDPFYVFFLSHSYFHGLLPLFL